MTVDVRVPDIGDFSDVAVIEVLVKPGDTVAVEQSLITIESDKASMEIPSSHAGVVKELKVAVGDKVNEGTLILRLDATADAGAAGAAGFAAGVVAAASPSRRRISVPSLTLSPTATLSSATTPACDDGISIDALSLSIVIRLCSTATVSPGLTRTSMTATSLKSPMSGTRTSTVTAAPAGSRPGPGSGRR